MSLKMVVGESFPRGFWMLDGTSPHSDYSGYGRQATSSSTTYGPSLVNSASRSLIVSNSSKVIYSAPVLVRGSEHLPFSIEAHVAPVFSSTTISEQQVLGRDGAMDGLIINGTVVSFVTKFSTTGEARASYDLKQYQSVHVAGVHTQNSNSLYVNGDLVAEVDITEEQQGDTYAGTSQSLSSGASASTNSLMLNGVAVYEGLLEHSAVVAHFEYARAYVNAENVANTFGGDLLEFSTAQTAPLIEEDFSVEEDWLDGGMFSVLVGEDSIYPETEDGLTVDASWEVAIPLEIEQLMYAGTVKWEGGGFVVETSRDGTSWTAAENGVNLSTIISGTSSVDQTIFIRVRFPAGQDPTGVLLDRLVFSLYSNANTPDFAGRKIVLEKASPEEDHDIKEYHENWGLELRSGSLTIKALTEDAPIYPKTIEVWARRGIDVLSDNVYVGVSRWRSNGGTGLSYRVGEWQLRHYVYDNGFTGDIVFSGTGQIGHVILYPNALSNDVIKEIYDSYVGSPTLRLASSDSFDIHELPDSVDISEYDWSIESSG